MSKPNKIDQKPDFSLYKTYKLQNYPFKVDSFSSFDQPKCAFLNIIALSLKNFNYLLGLDYEIFYFCSGIKM